MTDDVRLPEKWSKGSNGGFEFSTESVKTDDGGTERNENWAFPLRRYEISHNVKTIEDIALLRAFHAARRGASRSFLFKDWIDYTSKADGNSAAAMTDQPLGTGDGVTTAFQLVKRYADAVSPIDVPVLWPVAGTLLIAKNGVAAPTGWSVNRGTGIVTFTSAPALGVAITAGFQFDVPVHFEDDLLRISWDTINSRSAGSVPLEEVRA
ncbi:DUF2460 domain-containing protein [Sphingobium sp. JS3065]|uniref:DUF2460 domain-containing protein n=1 Tax=Sphingobium sp. JS3065 TaxID=2970925 RepID=UPI0022650568|nr:DUF2460 domain-containing protein [Sphingobium sp. JS3065]UZW55560.1 DUF2460 domain-containing protein [Sphingobium sp. JS3065]